MKRTFYTGAAIIYALNKKNDKDVDVFFWHVKQQNTIVELSEIDFIRNYLQKAVCHFPLKVSAESSNFHRLPFSMCCRPEMPFISVIKFLLFFYSHIDIYSKQQQPNHHKNIKYTHTHHS